MNNLFLSSPVPVGSGLMLSISDWLGTIRIFQTLRVSISIDNNEHVQVFIKWNPMKVLYVIQKKSDHHVRSMMSKLCQCAAPYFNNIDIRRALHINIGWHQNSILISNVAKNGSDLSNTLIKRTWYKTWELARICVWEIAATPIISSNRIQKGRYRNKPKNLTSD